LVGILSGIAFHWGYQNGWTAISKKIQPILLGLVIALSIFLFSISDLYYQALFPNVFSEIQLNIDPLHPGAQNEIVIKDIRVDQRIIDWNNQCQADGSYNHGPEQELKLVNDGNPGKLHCRVYPLKSIEIVLKDQASLNNLKAAVDGQILTQQVISDSEKWVVHLPLPLTLKLLIPNLIIYLDGLFWVLIFTTTWIAFLVKQGRWQEEKLVLPEIAWLFSGYLVCYFTFSVFPMLINQQPLTIPLTSAGGLNIHAMDYQFILNNARAAILEGKTMQWSVSSPGGYLFLYPLLMIDITQSYQLFTLIKIVFFIGTTFLLPIKSIFKKEYALPLFFVLTGLASYWFQYDIEDGQFYPLLYAFIVIAIWLFQKYGHNRFLRFISYALFCFAVQMKLSPFIFVVFFIRDWKDYKRNLIRLLSLGLVNFLLVFSAGWTNAQTFFNTIFYLGQKGSPVSGSFNHSIQSFTAYLGAQTLSDPNYIRILLYIIVLSCMGLLLWRFVWNKIHTPENYIDPFLLIGLTLCALLLPNENNDYALPILSIILSVGLSLDLSSPKRILNGLDLFVITLLYLTTTYAGMLKPEGVIFQNNCIPLVTLLVYITLTAYKNTLRAKILSPLLAAGSLPSENPRQ